MVRKSVKQNVPLELVEELKRFQDQLTKELGMKISFVNAGRAAAHALKVRDVKFIKVQPSKYKKTNGKISFDQ